MAWLDKNQDNLHAILGESATAILHTVEVIVWDTESVQITKTHTLALTHVHIKAKIHDFVHGSDYLIQDGTQEIIWVNSSIVVMEDGMEEFVEIWKKQRRTGTAWTFKVVKLMYVIEGIHVKKQLQCSSEVEKSFITSIKKFPNRVVEGSIEIRSSTFKEKMTFVELQTDVTFKLH
ncbi:hypothetical protein BC830DRAFT_1080755 [Chytriomyces sp. MP71]|nr:hypothetical protein BC830DRAFT_1080755 [Chytriomyces sp. MP71]